MGVERGGIPANKHVKRGGGACATHVIGARPLARTASRYPWRELFAAPQLTFTISMVMGVPLPFACSMYRLRSTSRNSKTR